MAYDYTRFEQIAISLIEKYGRTMYLRSITESGKAYNPVKTQTDTEVTGVQGQYTAFELSGESVLSKDIKIFISSEVEPSQNDKLVDGSSVYQIKNIKKFKPGDTVLYYELQVRP